MFLYMLHRYQKGLTEIVFQSPREEKYKAPDTKSASDQLCDLIFAIDERTGLPCGAYAQYMSPKTNAEVKKFIEDNILHGGEPMANMVDAQNAGLPSDVVSRFKEFKSDFLAEMNRGRGETLEQYEQRISDFLSSEKYRSEFAMRMSKSKDDKS